MLDHLEVLHVWPTGGPRGTIAFAFVSPVIVPGLIAAGGTPCGSRPQMKTHVGPIEAQASRTIIPSSSQRTSHHTLFLYENGLISRDDPQSGNRADDNRRKGRSWTDAPTTRLTCTREMMICSWMLDRRSDIRGAKAIRFDWRRPSALASAGRRPGETGRPFSFVPEPTRHMVGHKIRPEEPAMNGTQIGDTSPSHWPAVRVAPVSPRGRLTSVIREIPSPAFRERGTAPKRVW